MKKLNAFINWFPKVFQGKTHEENLMEISKSICTNLIQSKLDKENLTCEDVNFVLLQLRKDVKLEMEIKLFSEKNNLEYHKNASSESRDKIKKINELIKSL